ncbi:Alpha/Beta hydrolase protein [Obelidium mucronatum]|nr:Alpha/Beta hydrolase protein [Obelidium mucronatum]
MEAETDPIPLDLPDEKFFTLSDGRTLAYTETGDFTSRKLFIGFHGVFGVGAVSPHHNQFYASRGWRCISPSVPGWGRSSPFPSNLPLCAFASDIAQLIRHLVPPPTQSHALYSGVTHLVFFGGSYGSLWAYACAANMPPSHMQRIEPASAIRGLLVMGGFSPFRDHEGHTEGMSWLNYLTVGRPGQYFPLSLIHPFVGGIIQSKIAGKMDGSLEILRQILTGPKAMNPEERAAMETWVATFGQTFEEWERFMARNMALSVLHTLDGYSAVPRIINSDWGFRMSEILVAGATVGNSSHQRDSISIVPSVLPPVVIAGALRDHLAPIAMQRWVASQIPGAQFIALEGNHISGIISMLSMVSGLLAGIAEADANA